MAKKFFNKADSDVAIITSELADLHISSLAISPTSRFNPRDMSEPASLFSSLESVHRIKELIDLDKQTQKAKATEITQADATSTENFENPDLEENFPSQNVPTILHRINTGSCLFFDFNKNEMCKEPSIKDTARCIKHQDNANSKFMKILAEMSNDKSELGFHLADSVFRSFSRPEECLNQEVYEYAPCLEGALPAFKDSVANLDKVLLAGWESYRANMGTPSIPFDDKYYRKRFPNLHQISSQQWKHTFFATRVSYGLFRPDPGHKKLKKKKKKKKIKNLIFLILLKIAIWDITLGFFSLILLHTSIRRGGVEVVGVGDRFHHCQGYWVRNPARANDFEKFIGGYAFAKDKSLNDSAQIESSLLLEKFPIF